MTNRLAQITDFPFTRLNQLLAAVKPRANTPPVIMSLGEPQHEPPPILRQVLDASAADWARYPPNAGTSDFRQAVAAWLARRYGLPAGMIDPERHILPVSGTREALFMLPLATVPDSKAGGRPAVLMPNPFYHVYSTAAIMAGAEPVFLPATKETGFLPDLDAIEPGALDRAALFYLCSPANPQGAVADEKYLARILDLARRHEFVLAMDECYAEIYDRIAPPGVLGAAARKGGDLAGIMAFHSLSKRSSAPGLRSGFVVGDAALIADFLRLRSYASAGMPIPVMAASAALWRDEEHVLGNRDLYRRKFELADRLLGAQPGYYRPQGGFFLWLDVGDGEAAAERLWAEAAIKTLPGAYLSRPGKDGVNPGQRYIRIALVNDIATTERALTRMAELL